MVPYKAVDAVSARGLARIESSRLSLAPRNPYRAATRTKRANTVFRKRVAQVFKF